MSRVPGGEASVPGRTPRRAKRPPATGGEGEPAVAVAPPRSDGRRVTFEVLDGGRRIACAISHHALRDMATGGRRLTAGDLLECFAALRPQIEALALRKLRARRGEPLGVLYIWPDEEEDDNDELPSSDAGAPAAARALRRPG